MILAVAKWIIMLPWIAVPMIAAVALLVALSIVLTNRKK